MKQILAILGLLYASIVPSYADSTSEKELTLGFIPSRSTHEVQISSEAIARYLSEFTGYKIKSVTLSNYAGVAIAMKSKRVDFAFVGPLNYLVINEQVPVEPVTAAVRNGQKGYHSLIITKKDSGIETLADLKGKTFIFGDKLSTSASLYPKHALMSAGLNIKKDLRSLHMSSQTAITMAVIKGRADAGAIYGDARLNPEILKKYPNPDEVTDLLFKSELIPADPQIVRSDLPPSVKKRIQYALIKLSTNKESKRVLKSLYGIDRLEAADSSEYQDLLNTTNIVFPNMLAITK